MKITSTKQKKIIAVLLLLISVISLCGCGISKRTVKIGAVISDSAGEGYRQACLDGIEKMRSDTELGDGQISVIECADADNCYGLVSELVDSGCDLIFGFGEDIEDGLVQSATENPKIQFFVAYGTKTADVLTNYHSFSTQEYQSRYIAGVAAGEKLNDLIQNGEITKDGAILGYAAEFPDAESISAYSAFYLGARSVCETVRMNVQYTYSEKDADAERKAVMALIANGCRLISKQSDLTGCSGVCAENGAYYVGFPDGDENGLCVASAQTDMGACLSYIVECLLNKETVPQELCVLPDDIGAYLSELNPNAFSNEKMLEKARQSTEDAAQKLADGSLHVFDTGTWTVGGKRIETTASEELYDIYHGVEYIDGGRFTENELFVEPRFEFRIDGITELNYTEDHFSEDIGG